HPRFSGKYVNFEGVTAYPRPVQQPHPPFVLGGRSPAALRRAIKYCAGWYGYAMTVDSTREMLAALEQAKKEQPRGAGLGELEITIAPREPINAETVKAYEQLGV